jgi:hypothetical protein
MRGILPKEFRRFREITVSRCAAKVHPYISCQTDSSGLENELRDQFCQIKIATEKMPSGLFIGAYPALLKLFDDLQGLSTESGLFTLVAY